MKNLNRLNNFSFALIATALIITSGLVLGVNLYNIQSWQIKNIDQILKEAKSTKEPEMRLGLLAQSALLGKNDPVATEAYAQSLWQAGDYNESIRAYQESFLNINPNFLGNLALKADQANKAKEFFIQSNRTGENDEAYSGLAIVEYINGNTNKGCDYANKATKLNLSSTRAELANSICEILQNKSNLGARQQSYVLLDARMYAQALDRLQKTSPKNSNDWLAIARIYANRGDLNGAIDATKSAHQQSPESSQVISQLIQYLEVAGRTGETQIYADRLNELQFKNYQAK